MQKLSNLNFAVKTAFVLFIFLFFIYAILSNISKGTTFFHQGVASCGFRELVRYNLNRKSLQCLMLEINAARTNGFSFVA